MENIIHSQTSGSFPLGHLHNIPATRNHKEAAVLNMYKQKKLFL
jgi:hypothetical protein